MDNDRDAQGPEVSQRRSILYDIANAIRRSQKTAQRRSVLYDVAHVVLPVSFFLHFIITGTVVLIYTLYLHQPIPVKYSIGSAIAFGILSALILVVHLWLYFRRQQKRRDDIELASTGAAGPEKEAEDSSTGATQRQKKEKHEAWSNRMKDFLVDYDARHYHDILQDWTAPWQVRGRTINWNGVRAHIKEVSEPVMRLLGQRVVKQDVNERTSINESIRPRDQPIRTSDSEQGHPVEVRPTHSASLCASCDDFEPSGTAPRHLNRSVRRDSGCESPSHIRQSMELDAAERPLRDRNMGSFATDVSVQTVETGLIPEPQGLRPSPSYQQIQFPAASLDPAAISSKMSNFPGQRISLTATGQGIQGPQRNQTPPPMTIVRGDPIWQRRGTNSRRRPNSVQYTPWRPNTKLREDVLHEHEQQSFPRAQIAPTETKNPSIGCRNSQVSDLSVALHEYQQQKLPRSLRIPSDFESLPPGCRSSQLSDLSVDLSKATERTHIPSVGNRNISPLPARTLRSSKYDPEPAQPFLVPSPQPARTKISDLFPKIPEPTAKVGTPFFESFPVNMGLKTPPEGKPNWRHNLEHAVRGLGNGNGSGKGAN